MTSKKASSAQQSDEFESASAGLKVVLTVRFLLELALLGGVGLLAANLVADGWQWPAALLAVAAVATAWGLFLSPKAGIPLTRPAGLTLEAVLFVGTGLGLVITDHLIAAIVGMTVWVIHRIALALLRRAEPRATSPDSHQNRINRWRDRRDS